MGLLAAGSFWKLRLLNWQMLPKLLLKLLQRAGSLGGEIALPDLELQKPCFAARVRQQPAASEE